MPRLIRNDARGRMHAPHKILKPASPPSRRIKKGPRFWPPGTFPRPAKLATPRGLHRNRNEASGSPTMSAVLPEADFDNPLPAPSLMHFDAGVFHHLTPMVGQSRSVGARLHRRRLGRNPSGLRKLRRLRVPYM